MPALASHTCSLLDGLRTARLDRASLNKKEELMKVRVSLGNRVVREVNVPQESTVAQAISIAQMPQDRGYLRLINGSEAVPSDVLKEGDSVVLWPLVKGY